MHEEAVIAVQDTGLGMPPDLVGRVFDLFVQGERSPDRSEGGLGIGLTLVKRLVEMHGGSVEAASAGPNRGSCFTVRIPAAASRPRTGARPAPSVTGRGAGHRVLIIEDNRDVRAMLRLFLQLEGHEVHEAPDGPTGLEAALAVRPDIALVDIGLPGMDGYEMVRQLRAQADGPPPLLVALTGYGRAEDRQRMEAAGFDAYLIKPVDPAALGEVMARAAHRP